MVVFYGRENNSILSKFTNNRKSHAFGKKILKQSKCVRILFTPPAENLWVLAIFKSLAPLQYRMHECLV